MISQPDAGGHFGPYGGRYVPEVLMAAIEELEAAYLAARVTANFDFAQYDQSPAEALLLDGPAAELYGGAGHTFDWKLAAASSHRIIVAGGLDASNVARAVELAHPWGVDSCSRIESAPGKKDIQKMTDFLHAAKAALGA